MANTRMSYGCAVLMGAGRYVVNGPVCGHITGGNMKIATIIIVVLVNAHMVSDEAWSVTKHKYEEHQIPIPEENKCPRCAKPFGQKTKLMRHLLICNTDDYPFPCAECNKKFRQKGFPHAAQTAGPSQSWGKYRKILLCMSCLRYQI